MTTIKNKGQAAKMTETTEMTEMIEATEVTEATETTQAATEETETTESKTKAKMRGMRMHDLALEQKKAHGNFGSDTLCSRCCFGYQSWSRAIP